MKLFSELNGFVVYEPALLRKYLHDNNLHDNDVLKYFTNTEHGELITLGGIAIPVIGVNTGYYDINVTLDKALLRLTDDEVKVKSSGWIYHTETGVVNIIAVGYLKNINSIVPDKTLTIKIKEGWYSVDISCGEKEGIEDYFLEFLFTPENRKPKFAGDFETEYCF
ncbi:hypothetical protein [Paenibacillus macerans]|uniref:hypothetical protein n=1 Tax=Paenibacillus macerans TaxID=44252 RepID=UPI00203E9242|nr:hypothetical protein [Paenibacillus macerans]MCM3702628.1 hypothetical protein [Paenibacillus macerans]